MRTDSVGAAGVNRGHTGLLSVILLSRRLYLKYKATDRVVLSLLTIELVHLRIQSATCCRLLPDKSIVT